MDTSINWIKNGLDLLEKKIIEMGDWAVEMQSKLHVSFKEDLSPVTEVDMTISNEVVSLIKTIFPSEGIISEEEIIKNVGEEEYTFVLDPIDGTDVYSQGLPSFCISLGILDKNKTPVAAVIYAPRFGKGTKEGLLIRLNPGEKPLINNKELTVAHSDEKREKIYQLTLSSSLIKWIDFSRYEGKVRIFGSQILQILSPVLFSNITASINEPCYIWDYAGAHAIVKSLGMELYTPHMDVFTYTPSFLSRSRAETITYGGYSATIEKLISMCPPIKNGEKIIHN